MKIALAVEDIDELMEDISPEEMYTQDEADLSEANLADKDLEEEFKSINPEKEAKSRGGWSKNQIKILENWSTYKEFL